MNDCRLGVSPVNYPGPDPDPDQQAALYYKNRPAC